MTSHSVRLILVSSLALLALADHGTHQETASLSASVNSVSVPVSTSYNAASSSSSSSPSSSSLPAVTKKVKVAPSSVKAEEKSSSVSSSSYAAPSLDSLPPPVAGTPVSQGNLYYYYYPVAAYPIHDPVYDRDSSAPSHGSNYVQQEDSNLSPLIYLMVPLVLLVLAIPLFTLLGANVASGGRGFGRSNELDEKFGSFQDLQRKIDVLLDKYMVALDSHQCKDRIVCELGVKARGLSGKEMFFSIVGWLAPEHSILGNGRLDLLREAATKEFTMETCKKYVCHPPAILQEPFDKQTLMSQLVPSDDAKE